MTNSSRIDHEYAAITIAELRAALADLPAHYEVWCHGEGGPETADRVTALSVRVIDNAVILGQTRDERSGTMSRPRV